MASANVWHEVDSERITPDDFIGFIEISKGSKCKYELDKRSGFLILDRLLYTATHYPMSYGFIPKTLGDDGDPLDIVVLCDEPIQSNCLVRCKPIGIMNMVDGGRRDEKIICVSLGDPTFSGFNDIKELPQHRANELVHFFQVYKELEHKETTVNEVEGPAEAKKCIAEALETYRHVFLNH